MKLTESTIAILKNFSGINHSILLREGNQLRTISPEKTVMATATVKETFPVECAIYDLNRLLGVLTLFKNPDVQFEESHVTVVDGNNSVKIVYADPSIIICAPEKDIKLPSEDIKFTLREDQMSQLFKASSVVGVPDITVRGSNGVLSIVAHDKKNPSSNEFVINLGETDEVFAVDFKVERFKLLTDLYDVTISKKLIAKFEGAVTYFIACESTSTFA